MEKVLAHLTVSASDVRGVSKTIEKANGQPVAVLNHKKVQGYIVPAEAVQPIVYAHQDDIDKATDKILKRDAESVRRLKDR